MPAALVCKAHLTDATVDVAVALVKHALHDRAAYARAWHGYTFADQWNEASCQQTALNACRESTAEAGWNRFIRGKGQRFAFFARPSLTPTRTKAKPATPSNALRTNE